MPKETQKRRNGMKRKRELLWKLNIPKKLVREIMKKLLTNVTCILKVVMNWWFYWQLPKQSSSPIGPKYHIRCYPPSKENSTVLLVNHFFRFHLPKVQYQTGNSTSYSNDEKKSATNGLHQKIEHASSVCQMRLWQNYLLNWNSKFLFDMMKW